MLFDDKEFRLCLNCARAAELDEDRMLCRKKGPVRKEFCCAAFRYDPLKRDPARPRVFSRDDSADFSL